MPRGIESNSLGAAGTNQGQAQSSYNTLAPVYSRFATSPTGYTPGQMAGFNTASEQATGGSAAGAVGMGALASARTNNAGGYQASMDDAARQAGVTNSQNALQVQNQNAQLMQKQQAMGLQGLDAVYGTATNAGLGYENNALTASNDTNNAVMGGIGLGIQALTGGMVGAGALGYKPGCWIAEAIYGANDQRTHTVRAYLNGAFRQSRFGSLVMRLYIRHGQSIAVHVQRSRILQALFRPFFDRALSSALSGTRLSEVR